MSLKGLTLQEADADRIKAGIPELPLESVAGAAAMEPGRPVRLLGPRGEVVGAGVVDVENDVVRAWSRDPVAAFDAAFFRQRVARALALRRSLGLVVAEDSWRALNGEGDGLGGITADVYGPWGVVYAYAKGLWTAARSVGEELREQARLKGVVVKLRVKGGAKPGQVRQEVVGDEPPESVVVRELGVPFEVHPMGGLNVGLFTDMREHRRNIARFVAGRRVLNTFCYTGAISVAAARAGAASVTSVDLSSGVLKWAAENFRLSGMDPADPRWKFEVSDVARFVERELEAGHHYDTIVLDPPTYSAARAHAWSMKKDYPDLIANAARLCPEETGGFLWVSANAHGGKGVMQHAEEGLEKARRRAVVMEVGGLPPDYPTPLGWAEGRYLEVAFLRVLPE